MKIGHHVRGIAVCILVFAAAALVRPMFVLSQTAPAADRSAIEELNRKIAEKREKIKNIEKSISEYKNKIDSVRLEAVSLKNQMAVLENRSAQVELDIEATQVKIDTVVLELEELQLSIAENERTINRQKKILANLLQTLHYEDSKKYIEILAAYDSFSEFYNSLQYLSQVQDSLGVSVRSVRMAKEDLEEKQKQTEERRRSFERLNEDLSNRKKDLDEQIYAKTSLVAQTRASESTYQTLLGNLRRQYQQIESEIVSIEQEVRRRLESENRLGELGDSSVMSWPTPSRYITTLFHDPDYPFRHVFEHNAIDIRAAHGTAIRAAAPGYVGRARVCSSASCYSYIMIIHASGVSTVYGHMSKILVAEDQFVGRGDIIGYSGGTPGTVGAGPFVTGPHLHFEVRRSGIPVDPVGYLVKDY